MQLQRVGEFLPFSLFRSAHKIDFIFLILLQFSWFSFYFISLSFLDRTNRGKGVYIYEKYTLCIMSMSISISFALNALFYCHVQSKLRFSFNSLKILNPISSQNEYWIILSLRVFLFISFAVSLDDCMMGLCNWFYISLIEPAIDDYFFRFVLFRFSFILFDSIIIFSWNCIRTLSFYFAYAIDLFLFFLFLLSMSVLKWSDWK